MKVDSHPADDSVRFTEAGLHSLVFSTLGGCWKNLQFFVEVACSRTVNAKPYDQCRAAVRPMQGRRTTNAGPPYDQCGAAVRPMRGRRTTNAGPPYDQMQGRRTIKCRAAVRSNAGPPYDQMQGRRTINTGPPYDQCRAAVRSMQGRRTINGGPPYDQWRAAVLINGGPPY